MKKIITFAPLICVALYCIFTLLVPAVPTFGFVCALLLMLTGAFAVFRNSKIVFTVYNLVAVVATYLVYRDIAFSAVYALSYIAAGFWLCYSLLRKKGGVYAIIVTLICIVMADYGSVAISNVLHGKTALAFIDEIFDTLRPIVVETISQNAEIFKVKNAEQFFDLYAMTVKMFLPAIVIIIELIKTIILTFLTKVIVNRTLKGIAIDLRFAMFKADGVTVFVYLLSLLISAFAKSDVMSVVFGNFYIILSMVLTLCGLSLFDWYLRDIKKVRIFFRFLIIVFISAISLVLAVPVAVMNVLALVDARRNFREIGVITQDK